jgi:hypothetical protein
MHQYEESLKNILPLLHNNELTSYEYWYLCYIGRSGTTVVVFLRPQGLESVGTVAQLIT